MLKLQGCLKDYIWGGAKLKSLYGKGEGNAAESWEISVHPDGLSKTEQGFTLADYLLSHPYAVNKTGTSLPVLIKFIDAAKNLSVQVHPNDTYARLRENDRGKTEMWYIVHAEPSAGIFCGFRRDTSKTEFLRKLAEGTVEELLNFIPVKSGDCFLIEAGTVHAICAGCFVCEVQQSSNVTYRVYDYNRLGGDGKPRTLHISKAIDVINFGSYVDKTDSRLLCESSQYRLRLLTKCRYFCCRELALKGKYAETHKDSFVAVNVIDGEGTLNGISFKSGESFFVDCGESLNLDGDAVVLLTTE